MVLTLAVALRHLASSYPPPPPFPKKLSGTRLLDSTCSLPQIGVLNSSTACLQNMVEIIAVPFRAEMKLNCSVVDW